MDMAIAAALALVATDAVVALRAAEQQARRPRSAVGSIGNTAGLPIRKHSSGDQIVVNPLLFVIQARIQHRVGAILPASTATGSQSSPIASRTAARRRASSSVRS